MIAWRIIWRRLHLIAGLGAGLVLTIAGLTGALMSFEEEIMAALGEGVVTVAPRGEKLSPDALTARLAQARPDLFVAALAMDYRPERASRAQFLDASGARASRRDLYVDPYDGRILGPAPGQGFFSTVRKLHRWLLLPGDGGGAGRQLTGAAALCLLFLGASGLYLRWPARPLDWRNWLSINLSLRGRMLFWSLHAKIGALLLPLYLLSAMTGLWWSYEWWRAGTTYALTGAFPRAREREANEKGPPPRIALDPAWRRFVEGPDGKFMTALIVVPRGGEDIRIRSSSLAGDDPHAFDESRFDAKSGAAKRVERYADKTVGEKIVANMLELHRGRMFGLAGSIAMALAAALMPGFAATGLLLYLGRRRARRNRAPRA